jgi:hypothetical protein
MTEEPKHVIDRKRETDPEQVRILERLEEDELTFELGVETAEAGISFLYWPPRCLRAKEFKRGYRLAGIATGMIVQCDDLTVSEDGRIINKNIN